MQDFKISLITVAYNAGGTIRRCIESVIAQNYRNFEYIIIDGGSTDGTIGIVNQFRGHINIFVSEPDNGVYDAMNKGIMRSHGEIIGMLNADDYFAADDVLATISDAFEQQNADIVYGNLDYVKPNETILRKWHTKAYIRGMYNWGWMPPHPTFYCKKRLFEQLGFYNTEYGTAADYELMLRFMHRNNLGVFFIDKVLVKMQCGGLSNKSHINRIKAWQCDLKSMRENGILFPILTLIMKPMRKIGQYL